MSPSFEPLTLLNGEPQGLDVTQRATQEMLALWRDRDGLQYPLDHADGQADPAT